MEEVQKSADAVNGLQKKKSGLPQKKQKASGKSSGNFQYKNLVLMAAALVLLIYACFITVVPYVITKTFNTSQFAAITQEITGFVTNLDRFQYSIKPNLHGVIDLYNFSLKWPALPAQGIDEIPVLEAKFIEIETNNPLAAITKNFDINSLKVTNGGFFYMFIPNQESNTLMNNLDPVRRWFEPQKYGVKTVKIKPGDVIVKGFRIGYSKPGYYNEDFIQQKTYPKPEVRIFLMEHPVSNVVIR